MNDEEFATLQAIMQHEKDCKRKESTIVQTYTKGCLLVWDQALKNGIEKRRRPFHYVPDENTEYGKIYNRVWSYIV
jgi:hypothetical protein